MRKIVTIRVRIWCFKRGYEKKSTLQEFFPVYIEFQLSQASNIIIFLKKDEVATVLSLLSVNKELLNFKRWLTLVKLNAIVILIKSLKAI